MTDHHTHHFNHHRYVVQKENVEQRIAEVKPSELKTWTGTLSADQRNAIGNSNVYQDHDEPKFGASKIPKDRSKIPAPVSASHKPFAEFFADKVQPQKLVIPAEKPPSEKGKNKLKIKSILNHEHHAAHGRVL